MDPVVSVTGLRELRRDIRAIDKGLGRELNKGLREAVRPVVREAAVLAPRKTGALAASLRPYAAGASVGVRSRLPYANVIHWGGTTGKGHSQSRAGSVVLRRRSHSLADGRTIEGYNPFIWKAAARNMDRFIDDLGDAIEGMAGRHGWR